MGLPKTPHSWTLNLPWDLNASLKNSSKNDQNFMLCDSSKGWWDRKLPIKNHGNFLSHQDLLLSRNMKFWPFIELFSHVISCDFHVTFKKNQRVFGFSRKFPGHVHHFYVIFQNFMGSLRFSRITMGFSWDLPFSQVREDVWSFRPRKPLPWVPLSPISWVPTIFKILTTKKQMR